MNKLLAGLLVTLTLVFFIACQKEKSFELPGTPATGSLQEDGGGLCLPKNVNGTYVANTALVPATNTIDVTVDVTAAGAYVIYTDTVNDYHFRGTGNFTATGVQSVNLKGSGTPKLQGNNVFTVFFGGTECDITVQVLPAGSGGPAVFTLAGAGGGCTTPTINGIYVIGTALNASNTVVLSVNVTTIGTYNVTTSAVQGMTFSGSGTLTATGAQTITLTGSGTPAAPAGNVSVPVTVAGGTCNFIIPLLATAPLIDYFPRTANSNWSFEFDGDGADSLLMRVITATVVRNGNTYNLFEATDDITLGFDSAGYYRKNGSDYYRYTNLADYIGFDNDYFAEFIFIKDNLAVGGTWQTPGFSGTVSGAPATVRMSYRIISKDIAKTVATTLGNINYTNVIAVEEKYQALVGGNWVDLTPQLGHFIDYYSRNVGWIVSEFYDVGSTTTPDGVMEMRRNQVF